MTGPKTDTPREFDVIAYGATGYTGRLVAEYLSRQYAGSDLKWAMAGRSADKLAAVRDEIGAPADTPLIVADSDDKASLAAAAARTRVMLSTVGPYQLYGSDLVAACVAAGTDYVDLCGEPNWIRDMIDAHQEAAAASGARIVISCGFDSIPFDLGVYYLQEQAKAKTGAPCKSVRGLVRAMKGKFSGGTAASLKATMSAAFKDPGLVQLLQSSFALTPGFEGPKQPSMSQPFHDDGLGLWLAPFIMAPINTKNVHRTNFLLDHAYGKDFAYSEMMIAGKGEAGEQAAKAIAGDSSLMGDDAPKPGEGPTKEERETGFYDVLFVGETADGGELRASVKGDMDPGYGSTSKMIAEAAVCLAKDDLATPGGVWTPAAALDGALIKRLTANAGLTFADET